MTSTVEDLRFVIHVCGANDAAIEVVCNELYRQLKERLPQWTMERIPIRMHRYADKKEYFNLSSARHLSLLVYEQKCEFIAGNRCAVSNVTCVEGLVADKVVRCDTSMYDDKWLKSDCRAICTRSFKRWIERGLKEAENLDVTQLTRELTQLGTTQDEKKE